MKNILIKPTKKNLTSFVTVGGFLIFISFIDVLANTFLNFNPTSFLPSKLSYFVPLFIGTVGLYLIRIEFSGNKLLDKINTNFNSNKFNCNFRSYKIYPTNLKLVLF